MDCLLKTLDAPSRAGSAKRRIGRPSTGPYSLQTMTTKPSLNEPAQLSKSFEPDEIESRWYQEWERRGYFKGGQHVEPLRAAQAGPMQFSFRHPTSQAPCIWATRSTKPSWMGWCVITACRGMTRFYSRYGSRRHCDANRCRATARRPEYIAPRPWARKVPRQSMGVEGTIGQRHHGTIPPARFFSRLGTRVLHDGRKLVARGRRGFCPPA